MKQTHLLNFYNEFIIKQDYFECHEIMEDLWKEKANYTKNDPEVFLILIATAEYHYRRGNHKGAVTSYKRALNLYHMVPFSFPEYGLSDDALEYFYERLHNINYVNFKPFVLPLSDSFYQLLHQHAAPEKPYESFIEFLNSHHILNSFLINKHKLRNRSDIVADRLSALLKKEEE